MKKIYSLMIGRYQPLHDGHCALIQKVLDEGKNVLVAIRDTEISKNNPYNYRERWRMVNDRFMDAISDGKLAIIKIPDIEEVCYGRKVGWGIREIHLDKKTESISATKIRKNK